MDYGGAVLTSSLEANVALIKRIFENDGTVVERRVENRLRPKARCCIFFIDGMASNQIVDEYIVKPIIETAALGLSDDPAEELSRDVLSANDIRELEDLNPIPAEEGGDLYLINGNMTKLKDAGVFANMGGAAQGKEDEDNDQQKNKARNPC